MNELSPGAQALLAAMESEAQQAVHARGVGYAMIHEDKVGGVAANLEAIDELQCAGQDVDFSAGERDRIIQIRGARYVRAK